MVLYNVNGSQVVRRRCRGELDCDAQVCRQVELEHHRSPCRCACLLSAADCGPGQVFDPIKCRCHCDPSHNAAKATVVQR